jgi:hypothetical protein
MKATAKPLASWSVPALTKALFAFSSVWEPALQAI